MNSNESFSGSKKHLELTVNGRKVEADIDHHMTLAEFLREELDLTGTKVGCNRGECGSCTVIIDGMAVYSCTMLAVEAHGQRGAHHRRAGRRRQAPSAPESLHRARRVCSAGTARQA